MIFIFGETIKTSRKIRNPLLQRQHGTHKHNYLSYSKMIFIFNDHCFEGNSTKLQVKSNSLLIIVIQLLDFKQKKSKNIGNRRFL